MIARRILQRQRHSRRPRGFTILEQFRRPLTGESRSINIDADLALDERSGRQPGSTLAIRKSARRSEHARGVPGMSLLDSADKGIRQAPLGVAVGRRRDARNSQNQPARILSQLAGKAPSAELPSFYGSVLDDIDGPEFARKHPHNSYDFSQAGSGNLRMFARHLPINSPIVPATAGITQHQMWKLSPRLGNIDDNHYNAVKHAPLSFNLTRRLGPELAKEFTDTHERESDKPRSVVMHLHNNEVGRFLATDEKNRNRDPLKVVIEALISGKLAVRPEQEKDKKNLF